MLRAIGHDIIIGIDKSGAAWRGKAMSGGDSHHVVINRYAEVYGHLDRKSISRREVEEKARSERSELVATLMAVLRCQFRNLQRMDAHPDIRLPRSWVRFAGHG